MSGNDTPPHSLPPAAVDRDDPRIMRVRKLIQPLTCCSSQENRSGTSPAKHSRADPGCEVAGDLTLGVGEVRELALSVFCCGQ